MPEQIVNAMVQEVEQQLRDASLVVHPGETGAAREAILSRFIRSIVPLGFDVSTGFVVDSTGQRSKQQDIIIVRRDYHPVFTIGGVHFFPVEAVAATIEVKSTLTNATLQQAIENVRSVKCLDRTAQGTNYTINGTTRNRAPLDVSNHKNQVLAIIVAVTTSMTAESAASSFAYGVREKPRQERPNAVVVADKWSIGHFRDQPGYHAVDQMKATHLGLMLHPSAAGDKVTEHPLRFLASNLWSFLRVTPLIDAPPSSYLPYSLWSNIVEYTAPSLPD